MSQDLNSLVETGLPPKNTNLKRERMLLKANQAAAQAANANANVNGNKSNNNMTVMPQTIDRFEERELIKKK